MAEAIRQEAGADFVFATSIGPVSSDAFVSGTTRLADLTALLFYEPIGVMDLSGAELLADDRALQTASNHNQWSRLHPSLEPGKIDPARRYQVAVSAEAVSAFAAGTKTAPRSFRMTDLQAGEAIERFLVPKE
jgi:hypothetical protein